MRIGRPESSSWSMFLRDSRRSLRFLSEKFLLSSATFAAGEHAAPRHPASQRFQAEKRKKVTARRESRGRTLFVGAI